MNDRIVTLKEIADERLIPLSLSALYHAAAAGDGPFYKVRGKWMAIESELKAWVREGDRGGSRPRSRGNPMPSRRSKEPDALSEIYRLREKA